MTIVDTRVHFAASKRRDYIEGQMQLFRALSQFLTEEKLCAFDVLARFEAAPSQLVLTEEDFTEAGITWIRGQLHPWLQRYGRRKNRPSFQETMESLRETKIEPNQSLQPTAPSRRG